MLSVPDLLEVDDYRDWLGAALTALRARQGRSAIPALASRVECCPAHLRNIAARRRALRSPYRERLADALHLSREEAAALVALTDLQHGRTGGVRQRARERLDGLRADRAAKQAAAASRAAPLATLTVAALRRADVDLAPDALAAGLWPPITPVQARAALHGPPPDVAALLPAILGAARLARDAFGPGERLARMAYALAPTDRVWALGDATAALDELEGWCAGQRSPGAPRQWSLVALEHAPLTGALGPMGTGSSGEEGTGPLTAGAGRGTQGLETAPLNLPRKADGSPCLLAIDDYRAWLRALFEHRRDAGSPHLPRLTRARFARGLGLTLSTYEGVVAGTRTLPLEALLGVCEGAGLLGVEAVYLRLLVTHNDSREPAERARLLYDRMTLPGVFDARPAEAGRVLASSVLHMTLVELARHPDFRPDPAWIRGVLAFDPRGDIGRALEHLCAAGLLAPDARGVPRPTASSTYLLGPHTAEARLHLQRDLSYRLLELFAANPADSALYARVFEFPKAAAAGFVERVKEIVGDLWSAMGDPLVSPDARPLAVHAMAAQVMPVFPIPWRRR